MIWTAVLSFSLREGCCTVYSTVRDITQLEPYVVQYSTLLPKALHCTDVHENIPSPNTPNLYVRTYVDSF